MYRSNLLKSSPSHAPKRRGTKKQLEIDALILRTLNERGAKFSLRSLSRFLNIPVSTISDHLEFLVSKRLLASDWANAPSETSLSNKDFSPELKNILSK